MKIYFIKFQLKIFPFEINNMIAEYLYENYFKIQQKPLFLNAGKY